jgi:hypothetical protein
MKPHFRGVIFALALAASGLFISGCRKSPESVAAGSQAAFQSAPADVKTKWDKALAAVKANDYATALIALRDLQYETNLSPVQQDAVGKTATAVSDRMYEAANKGDAKATAAIETVRKAMGR